MSRSQSADYRPDIDGLRAVAVLSVVAFHLGAPRITGGFIGVDVFFVISGYLITGILAREIGTGTFSLVEFYKRRARRILPALAVMLVATSVAVTVVLLTPELAGYRNSLLAAAFFCANIYFWRSTNYFAQPAADQPLLHTWSLGVEEQYYVLFPLLLMVVARYAWRRLPIVLWTVTIASFVLSVVVVRVDQNAAFYLLPTRAWELGAGALLATGAVPALRTPWLRHALSAVGGALVLVGCVKLTESTPFPGEAALLPVLGAAALIHCGPSSIGGRILSLRPFTFVGLISYSLYLWHWPLIVLYRAENLGVVSSTAKVLLGLTAFALAVLSWRFVETPMRRVRLRRRRSLAAYVSAVTALCVAAAFAVQPAAEARPANVKVARLLAAADARGTGRLGQCFIISGSSGDAYDPDVCLRPVGSRPSYLLMGDSHAAALWTGLQAALPDVTVMQATASGCKPLLPLSGEPRCTTVMATALDRLEHGLHVDLVILAARWQLYDESRLRATVQRLRSLAKQVLIIGPTSEYAVALPTLLARGVQRHDPDLAQKHLDQHRFAVDASLRQAALRLGVPYISQLDLLCPGRVCREYTATGVPMKFDYGHYTEAGSREIALELRPAILAAAQALRT